MAFRDRIKSMRRVKASSLIPNPKNFRVHGDEQKSAVTAALEEVGLADRVNHYPTRMSGGEQQRVAIARALVNKPAIILADEPTGNLDAETGETITNLLWERIRERNCTMVMVTHEPVIAQRADRHCHLAKGRLEKAIK